MKITKGQLKRIIAEEHALVYGTRKPARKKTRRLTTKQRRIVEAKKKRAILAEVRRNYACDAVLEEGLGKFLSQLGGMFTQGFEKVKAVRKEVGDAWTDLGTKFDADEKLMTAFTTELKDDLKDISGQLQNQMKKYNSFKAIVDGLKGTPEEIDAKTKEVFAAGLALLKTSVAAAE
jgi:hypothetical protein